MYCEVRARREPENNWRLAALATLNAASWRKELVHLHKLPIRPTMRSQTLPLNRTLNSRSKSPAGALPRLVCPPNACRETSTARARTSQYIA
eukprot:4554000-Lingulodinium_polyedra.AAC.1